MYSGDSTFSIMNHKSLVFSYYPDNDSFDYLDSIIWGFGVVIGGDAAIDKSV